MSIGNYVSAQGAPTDAARREIHAALEALREGEGKVVRPDTAREHLTRALRALKRVSRPLHQLL